MRLADFPEAEVLSAAAAPVALEWARALLREQYGLADVSLTALSGERDANFLLRRADERPLMLKLSHPVEAPRVADFQTQALLHIAATDPALPVQRLIRTRDGRPSFDAQPPGGSARRVVRLFSYLPGLPMIQARGGAAQRANVARMLARLDLALADLRHPAAELELPWDIQRADRVRPLLAHVADPARRALAERALDAFGKRVRPTLQALRRQPIHNDFNSSNLLVDERDPDRIAGVLDFGDMVQAPLIDDLAVAASYQIDEAAGDALGSIVPFVAAYHAVLPLQADEIELLFDLIRARLVMVCAISGWRAARHPENAEYLLRNNAVSWARLKACDGIALADARAALHQACAPARGARP